jgi:hypothetical protein
MNCWIDLINYNTETQKNGLGPFEWVQATFEAIEACPPGHYENYNETAETTWVYGIPYQVLSWNQVEGWWQDNDDNNWSDFVVYAAEKGNNND